MSVGLACNTSPAMSLNVSCFVLVNRLTDMTEGRGSFNTKVAKSKGRRLSVTVLENEYNMFAKWRLW